jgi:hypothetical protein
LVAIPEPAVDGFSRKVREALVEQDVLRQPESRVEYQGVHGIIAGVVPAIRLAISTTPDMPEAAMQDLVADHAFEQVHVLIFHVVGIEVEVGAIYSHPVLRFEPWRIFELQFERKCSEKRLLKQ